MNVNNTHWQQRYRLLCLWVGRAYATFGKRPAAAAAAKAHLYHEFVVCLWWLCHSDKCVVRNGWQINDVKDCPIVTMVVAVFVTCWAMSWMFVRYIICNSVLTILCWSLFIKYISVNTDKNKIPTELRPDIVLRKNLVFWGFWLMQELVILVRLI